MTMKTIIIIPARYKSTRYPAKPLSLLNGKPAILWTIEAASSVSNIDEVFVATDSLEIKSVVEAAGGRVVMTSESCKNGTERVAEAALIIGAQNDDIIINFQGDAPLTPYWFVDDIIIEIKLNKSADMITPILRCDTDSYLRFINDRRHGRVGATTTVFDRSNRALYFSKEVIPYLPSASDLERNPVYHHVGVYGYRMSALKQYPTLSVGPLESVEQLEQLRFLENGQNVYVVEVQAKGHEFWELNNPEDTAIIEAMMTRNKNLKIQ